MPDDAIRPSLRPFMTLLSLSRPTLNELTKWLPNVTFRRFPREAPPTTSEPEPTTTTTTTAPPHLEPQIPTPTRFMSSLRGRDLAAFLLFSEERRRELLKATPGMSFWEVTSILEEEWENMTKNKRAIWRCMIDDEEPPAAAQNKGKDPAPPAAAYQEATTTPREHYRFFAPGQRRALNNQLPPARRPPSPEAGYVDLPKLPRGAYPYDPVKPGMTASDINQAKCNFEMSLEYEKAQALPSTMAERL
ncbi:hypothetical protein DL546_001005, partial [Coniochaeta pulveracea]